MENKIREICREKGIKMSELANRVGMTQSNLVASLRKNPRYSTLEDIAKALDLEMYELFSPLDSPTLSRPVGSLCIDGKIFSIEQTPGALNIPVYNDSKSLQVAILNFTQKAPILPTSSALCGIFKNRRLFSLVSSADDISFTLMLCESKDRIIVKTYCSEDYVLNDRLNFEELYQAILVDIEYYEF